MSAKLQAAYEALAAGFLLPLLEGSTATLARPVAPGALDHFTLARPGSDDVHRRIFDGLHRAASELAPLSTVPWPSRDLVAIAMAAHDLVLLTDPSLDRLLARGARTVILGWVDRLTERIGSPATRGDALARHAILAPVLALRRRDTVVRNWAYTYRFFGRRVPANVVALPRLRLVTQEHRDLELGALVQALDQKGLGLGPRLRALVARSPVTELCAPERFAPLVPSAAMLSVLGDTAVRGGIARQIVARGAWKSAAALGAALVRTASPERLGPYVRLCLEVHLTSILDRQDDRPAEALAPDAARHAAILVACAADPGGRTELSSLDTADRARVRRRIERLRPLVPAPILAETATLVAAAFGSLSATEVRS